MPKITLRCKRTATEVQFWDSLRGKWLVLTPEEWVRRHVIGLFERLGYGAGEIAQEVPVDMHGADHEPILWPISMANLISYVSVKSPKSK